jgi:hypothetical protein
MRGIIQHARQGLKSPEAGGLNENERQTIEKTLASVEELLAAGGYAAAWYQLTHHRFWSLYRERLEDVAQP